MSITPLVLLQRSYAFRFKRGTPTTKRKELKIIWICLPLNRVVGDPVAGHVVVYFCFISHPRNTNDGVLLFGSSPFYDVVVATFVLFQV
jgi:hypothetical protein